MAAPHSITGPLQPTAPGQSITSCLEAVTRADRALGQLSGVTWVCVFPATSPERPPRVHVMVQHPHTVRSLAGLPAEPGALPPFCDHPTDPSWAGRVNGIWLHVAVDFDRPHQGVG